MPRTRSRARSAAALDQSGHAVASQFAEGGVGGEAAGAAGPFGGPVELVAGAGIVVGEIGGAVGEGGAVGVGVGDEGVAGIVGDVEPFVAVGGPGVGGFDAAQEMAEARGGGGPEAEGAVDVDPGAVAVGDRRSTRRRVVGADVEVAGLEEDDGGAAVEARLPRACGVRRPRLSAGMTSTEARPMPSRRRARSTVPWRSRAGDDADRAERRRGPAARRPSRGVEHGVPGGGEAGDVGHLAAGDEGEAGGGGQAEDVLEPGAGDFFDDGGGGSRGVEPGGLVPGAGEPVGREGGGDGAADHPAEEARTSRADDAAFDVADEVADDLGGVDAGRRRAGRPRRASNWSRVAVASTGARSRVSRYRRADSRASVRGSRKDIGPL